MVGNSDRNLVRYSAILFRNIYQLRFSGRTTLESWERIKCSKTLHLKLYSRANVVCAVFYALFTYFVHFVNTGRIHATQS